MRGTKAKKIRAAAKKWNSRETKFKEVGRYKSILGGNFIGQRILTHCHRLYCKNMKRLYKQTGVIASMPIN
jgi:hypothetical protein